MSEEQIVDTDVKTEEGTKPESNDIPRSRLNEVIVERNTLREQIEKYELQEKDSQKVELAQQEKWHLNKKNSRI